MQFAEAEVWIESFQRCEWRKNGGKGKESKDVIITNGVIFNSVNGVIVRIHDRNDEYYANQCIENIFRFRNGGLTLMTL